MKIKKLDIGLILIIAICLFLVIILKRCDKPKYIDDKQTKKEFSYLKEIDSLKAEFDNLDNYYSDRLILSYDTIEYYKQRLKERKIVYRDKIKFISSNDTIIKDEDYKECCFGANEIIMLQDSIINGQDTALKLTTERYLSLEKQYKELRTRTPMVIKMDCGSYKKQRNIAIVVSIAAILSNFVR